MWVWGQIVVHAVTTTTITTIITVKNYRGSLHSLSQGRRDELGVRRAVLDAELLDESDEIFLVLVGQTHIARVFVALPPEEAGNRVALLAWVECGDVAEYLVGGADWKGRS